MSQMFLATRVPRQTVRTWAGLLSGSLALAGAMNGYTQEIYLPKGLPRVSSDMKHVPPNSLTRGGHSSLESESDSLPVFPVAGRFDSATSEGYRPVASQPSRSGFIPTGLPRTETRPEWTLRPVSELELAVYSGLDLPENAAAITLHAAENGMQPSIANVGTVAAWVAPNLTYQPLLFEDARLERNGFASPYYGIQPIRSGVHFASSATIFPWRAWFHRNECESPLAFQRPGSWAPMTRENFVPAISSIWFRP